MIKQLLQEWQKTISADHHKSKDNYFFITKTYDYGEDSGWVVSHDGYLNEWESPSFATPQLAEQYLAAKLREMIKDYKEFREENENTF